MMATNRRHVPLARSSQRAETRIYRPHSATSDSHSVFLGHEAQDGDDGRPGHKAGATVEEAESDQKATTFKQK